jgi:pimeloyl-ACP methyl ester carboxylesterase
MYQEQHLSRTQVLPIRGVNYHLRVWGQPSAKLAPVFLLHGWMDVSASWQFVVDAWRAADPEMQGRQLIAPDWRGFGRSMPQQPVDSYNFHDYLADLEALLAYFAPDAQQSVDLVGHSMGANIATAYAGIRPARVRKLVNLEGFGLPDSRPSQAPGRYAQWLDELAQLHNGTLQLKTYTGAEGVAQRLTKTNPRLSPDKALWLAHHWAEPIANGNGQWRILGDNAHKVVSARLYRVDEIVAIYQRITAPTLAIEASDNSLAQWFKHGEHSIEEHHRRLGHIANCSIHTIANAGHMVHHDQPTAVAHHLKDFLGS